MRHCVVRWMQCSVGDNLYASESQDPRPHVCVCVERRLDRLVFASVRDGTEMVHPMRLFGLACDFGSPVLD
jgi:hypothetical protein